MRSTSDSRVSRLLARSLPARRHARVLASCTALLLAACGGGDDPPAPSAATPAGSPSVGAAVVGAAVATVPAIRVTDAKGRGVKDVLVRWRVSAGGGRVTTDSVRTSASGDASSGGWTLGTTVGPQTLMATADGLAPVTFTAEAGPAAPARLVRLSPETQQAAVNTIVGSAPSVRVEDQYGNPVPGTSVFFSVASGGGIVTGETATANASGIATVLSWKLGTTAGTQVLRATVIGAGGGTPPAAFVATATAGAPAAMTALTPVAQDALGGRPVSTQPGVRVDDEFGNPVGNVTVHFTPGPSSGTVSGASVTTDPANGTAFVGDWTLGDAPQQTLVASVSGLARSVTFTAAVTTSLFNITVRYIGVPPSARQQLAVERAVAKWRGSVLGQTGTSRVVINAGGCGRSWLPAVDTVVTNILIYAQIGPIDGNAGVLGNANACANHPATGLTAFGTMLFDSEDLSRLETNGLVDQLIAHEMGHVLGVGTRWASRGLVTGALTDDPIFTGTAARDQFTGIGGSVYGGRPVPVENTGGSGTRDVHWRESVFRNELMTGFLNSTGGNPLSRVTIGSLADMGYIVNYPGSDEFLLPGSTGALLDLQPGMLLPLGNDIVPIPPSGTARVYPVATPRRER